MSRIKDSSPVSIEQPFTEIEETARELDRAKKAAQKVMSEKITNQIKDLCDPSEQQLKVDVPRSTIYNVFNNDGYDPLGIHFSEAVGVNDKNVSIYVFHGTMAGGNRFEVRLSIEGEGHLYLNPVKHQALGSDIAGMGTGSLEGFSRFFDSKEETSSIERLEFTHKLVAAVEKTVA